MTVRSSRSDTVAVAPGGVFTAPFSVMNHSADSIQTTPVITLPKGWSIVNSMAPSVVAANGMELWLLSVSAPAAAPAGIYVLRAGMRAGDVTATDSVIVAIAERRELDVRVMNAKTYVLSGDTYEANFVVRNKGNVASRISLHATSNHGAKPKLSAAQIDLAGGANTTVTVTVAIPGDLSHSVQELLELVAIDMNVDSVRAATSLETTVIPNGADIPEFWTIPGSVSLRAAAPGTGVSPIVASGSGRISQYSDINVDFSLRSAAGPASIFGERDEYRFGIKNSRGGVRLGDDQYGFSLLTSSGGQGTGGEVRGNFENYVSGAYVQRNRWNLNAPTEMAAMIGTSPDSSRTSASLVALERGTGGMTSHVLAGTAQTMIKDSHIELEAAASDSLHLGGGAAIARFFGSAPTFTYDLGAQTASGAFAGAQRASSDEHATISGQKVGPVILTAMTSIHQMNPTVQSAGFGQKIATSSLSANFMTGSAIEFERYDRTDRGSPTAIQGNQQSLRFRGHFSIGAVDLSGVLQQGIVAQADSASTRAFTTVSGSARVEFGHNQFVSAFSEVSDGHALGASGIGTVTGGGSTELHFAKATTIRLTGSVTAQRNAMSAWAGQGDFSVEHAIRQSIVAFRGRMAQSGSKVTAPTNAFFLEVRTPLHLPTSRLDLGGRARAQVVDAETGKGVAGALVRLGEHAAITDKNGSADFRGLELGEYHAAVEGGIAAGQLVSGGDAINVGATNIRKPLDFQLNVARGAHVVARLRTFEKNVAAPPNGVDSVIDNGAVAQGSVVALISGRDTLWQSSDDRGRIDFGSVAPGHYTMAVVAGEIPEFMAYENKEIAVDVAAGDQREVEFRLLPQPRAVEFVTAETVLVAAPVAAPAPTQSAAKPRPTPNPMPKSQRNNNNDSN